MARVWIDYITSKLAIGSLLLFLFAIVSLALFCVSVVVPGGEQPYFILPVYYGFPLAFISSVIAFTLCFFCSKIISKWFWISLSTLLFSLVPTGLLAGVQMGARARQQAEKANTGIYNLRVLSEALKSYATKHNGQLPKAQEWCDALLADKELGLSRENFVHPMKIKLSLKGECQFAFNKNLSEKTFTDIPGDVVLLFEADGDWNLNGGAELLQTRYRDNGYIVMIFANGEKSDYWFYEKAVRKFDSKGTRMYYDQPRWAP